MQAEAIIIIKGLCMNVCLLFIMFLSFSDLTILKGTSALFKIMMMTKM